MCRGYFSSQEIDPHHATEHRSTDQSRNGCGMCCFCHAQPFEITRAKNIKNPLVQRSCQNAKVVEAFCSRRVHHRDRHQHTIPIALAALPGATLPRLRALALFGRRPPQRVDSLLMPASENLHNSGHRVPFFARACKQCSLTHCGQFARSRSGDISRGNTMQITRTHMLVAGATAAAAALTPKVALAGRGADLALSRPGHQFHRPEFCEISRFTPASNAFSPERAGARGRYGLGDARCLLWSDIPNNLYPAVGRGDRPHLRVPAALEHSIGQHPRPPGPPRHLRVRSAPPVSAPDRRHGHGADGQVRRQAAHFAQRPRGQI